MLKSYSIFSKKTEFVKRICGLYTCFLVIGEYFVWVSGAAMLVLENQIILDNTVSNMNGFANGIVFFPMGFVFDNSA